MIISYLQVTLVNVTPHDRIRHDDPDYVSSMFTHRPEIVHIVNTDKRRLEFNVTLKPGNCYRVTVTALHKGDRLPHVDSYRSIGTEETEFKAGLGFGKRLTLRCII